MLFIVFKEPHESNNRSRNPKYYQAPYQTPNPSIYEIRVRKQFKGCKPIALNIYDDKRSDRYYA